MVIVGSSVTSVNIERKGHPEGKFSIDHNTSIKDIKKEQITLGTQKRHILKIAFEFTAKYATFGTLVISGDVAWSDEDKDIEELEKKWKKDKKLPSPIMAKVINLVFRRCIMQAFYLAREVDLPPPIPIKFPEVKPENIK